MLEDATRIGSDTHMDSNDEIINFKNFNVQLSADNFIKLKYISKTSSSVTSVDEAIIISDGFLSQESYDYCSNNVFDNDFYSDNEMNCPLVQNYDMKKFLTFSFKRRTIGQYIKPFVASYYFQKLLNETENVDDKDFVIEKIFLEVANFCHHYSSNDYSYEKYKTTKAHHIDRRI